MSSFAEPAFRPLWRTLSAFRRCRAGATAVETSLVLPVFLMLILGTVEFGRVLQAWNEAGHALGKAVRVVNLDSGTTPSEIAALISSYTAGIKTENVSVQVSGQTISGTEYVKIAVSFPFELSLPFGILPTITLKVDTLAPKLSALK